MYDQSMYGLAAIGGIGSLILLLFLFVVAVLAFLMPFFVFRIRNEVIAVNRKLDRLIDLLSAAGTSAAGGKTICPSCGALNRMGDSKCIRCQQPLA